jgi:hypothetical protein
MADQGVPTSFIPQDATTTRRSRVEEGGGGVMDLLTVGAIVLFVVSAGLGAATFLYSQYMNQVSSQKSGDLKKAKDALDPNLFVQLERLDTRMHTAEGILDGHVAPSALFSALNQTTLQTIAFSNLSFTSESGQLKMKMAGVARSVNSIALQADIFSKSGVITAPIFSGIDRQPDGVHFNVNATVNPAALNYVGLINGTKPAGVNQVPIAPQSQGSTTLPFQGQQ